MLMKRDQTHPAYACVQTCKLRVRATQQSVRSIRLLKLWYGTSCCTCVSHTHAKANSVGLAQSALGAEGDAQKKKKKKKKNKKKSGAVAAAEGSDASAIAAMSTTSSPAAAAVSNGVGPPTKQTEPPSVPVRLLFPSGKFPEGEWQSYKDDNLWRETSAEKRDLERLQADMINDVRQAAEVHRQVGGCSLGLAALQKGSQSISLCMTGTH